MKRIWIYNIAVFISAFLLFQIQPMIAKTILPVFGGSYMVWGACMVFFQTVLLLGYLYAHIVQRRYGVLRYGRVHCALMLLPFVFMPSGIGNHISLAGRFPLTVAVFGMLSISVGIPFLMLSTTSLILQRWLSHSDLPERTNPYVLYASSNLGSMFGLLTYPIAVEPALPLARQEFAWWTAYGALVGLHLLCFPWRRRAGHCAAGPADAPIAPARPDRRRILQWFLLSAAPCAAFVAVTNVLTLDLASVPLLWILPLSVYLAAFVIAFKRRRWRPRRLDAAFRWATIVGMMLYVTSQVRLAVPWQIGVPVYLGALFILCVRCANAVSDARPDSERSLTAYYLTLAAGGMAGSLAVTWVIPPISRSLVEYPLSFMLAAIALGAAGSGAGSSGRAERGIAVVCALGAGLSLTILPSAYRLLPGTVPATALLVMVQLPFALVLLAASRRLSRLAVTLAVAAICSNWTELSAEGGRSILRLRNYYGIYHVYEKGNLRYLEHGTTQHGRQYISGPRTAIPQAYFHPSTPAAQLLRAERLDFRRIGMIGLGTGALASYCGTGRTLTIYELDPDNVPIAENYFTYLGQAREKGAEIRFVTGDGRVGLRGAEPGSLDLIIVDAFNSGSIPVHLLTRNAFEEYFRALDSGGILLLHVSNRLLELEPIVFSNAKSLGYLAARKEKRKDSPDVDYTSWMAVTRDESVMAVLEAGYGWDSSPPPGLPEPWTDDYGNILSALLR